MKLFIVGHGGHSKVIADVAIQNGYEIVGYVDDKYEIETIENELILGPIASLHKYLKTEKDTKVVIAIGHNAQRQVMMETLALDKSRYATLIHSNSWISPQSEVGHGSVVMANAVIQAGSIIGDHVIINTNAVVEHDSAIGDFVHIAPSATLTGMTTIRTGVQLGASATVLPGKTIGEWAIVGASATVIHDIPMYCTAIGVPAKIKQKEGDSIVKRS
ncbi:acetyltransferase [Halalkalibacter sp. AB-rgal2]|uniref:acetyltransferase n=1 Tax=Halalkalibacter sp. AB-rgal2 TaxID=3242695 RepID=UPI00359D7136